MSDESKPTTRSLTDVLADIQRLVAELVRWTEMPRTEEQIQVNYPPGASHQKTKEGPAIFAMNFPEHL